MTSSSIWRCRSCRTQLGQVGPQGGLDLLVLPVQVDHFGIVRVACPACGAVREWRPKGRAQDDGHAA